jgi:ketosteroid isomerase-like protein
MSPEESKQAVLRFLDAMAARDVDGLVAQLTPDARWWPPQSAEGRIPSPLVGARPIAELAGGKTLASFQPGTTRWDVRHMTAEDDRVAALMHRKAVGAAGGAYDVRYHWLFRFEGERLAEVWEVLDTSTAQRQLAS